MKFIALTIFFLIIGLSTSIHASKIAPEKCPSTQAIKVTHFWVQKDFSSQYYFAIQENQKYDTSWQDGTWTFKASYISAKSIDEATQVATNALNTLVYNAGPIKTANGWLCVYTNKIGIETKAITDY